MLELIRDILKSDAGSFGFVVGLLVLAFYLVHFVTKKVTAITSENAAINKHIDKFETCLDDIRKDISYLKGSLDIIKSSSDSLIQAHSPISLTELGKKVSQEIGVNEILARNWSNIESILERDLVDKSAYDIQQYCIEEVSVEPEKFFTKEDLDKIKQYAFEHGKPVEIYTRMIGVLIRDKYFEVKGITPSEVDKK